MLSLATRGLSSLALAFYLALLYAGEHALGLLPAG